ncbi:hypothetical protein C0993_005468 [Termitomyces sp. T159_Od127]|nr:hypothetical protein C0993_005468 [Termitomyces sp. T159_Od127]
MKFLDFEAHIVVDGENLPEYGVEYNEKKKTAVCWVPSQAGKVRLSQIIAISCFNGSFQTFSITGMPLGKSDVNIAGNVYADGFFVEGIVFRKGKSWSSMTWSAVSTSATTGRLLTFAPIELTGEFEILNPSVIRHLIDASDDETILSSTNSEHLGQITITISRVEILSENMPFTKEESKSRFTNHQMHERCKKAMVHKINLGAEVTQSPCKLVSPKYLEELCTLTFNYRSIDVLRADGIAPPASVSSVTEGKRKSSEDDDDDKGQNPDESDQEEEQDRAQLKALLGKINALEAKLAKKGAKVKSKKVKTEHRPAFIPGEVIDLTL